MIITPVSVRELDCIPDKPSVRSQSADRQPAHNMLYTLYIICISFAEAFDTVKPNEHYTTISQTQNSITLPFALFCIKKLYISREYQGGSFT